MVSFRITKNGFIGNGSGSLTGSLLGTASHAITASSVAWKDVTEKPSVYPAADHDHTGNNLKPTSVTTTGDITVGGNLVVSGSQTIINTENLTVKDKLIEIASGSTTKAMIDGAGIQFGEASLNASIKYENSGSTGAFVSPIDIHAPNIDIWKKGTGTDSAVQVLTGHFETGTPSATGIGAIATGVGTRASGIASHAEGYVTTASKDFSHAEGSSTTASGEGSHAEGYNTVASNDYEHAQGQCNHSSNNQIFSVGAGETINEIVNRRNAISVLAIQNASTQILTSSFFVQNIGGYDGTNPTPGTNDLATVINGVSSIWKKGEGTDSVVQKLTGIKETYTPTATKVGAVAIGYQTTASGKYSHAEGYGTIASGDDSHAEGSLTTSSGVDSHAEGQGTNASGDCSHAEGYGTVASGVASHAEGLFTIATNTAEHAQGQCNHNSTNQIFSVGAGEYANESINRRNAVSILAVPNADTKINTATFFVQNVGGYDGTNPTPGTNDLATVINGVSSIWKKGTGQDSIVQVLTGDNEVNTPSATGIGAVAIGLATVASETSSHAEGVAATASGICSHAEGYTTAASGLGSHAEGFNTTATGEGSHAEGFSTTATGEGSHAEGRENTASGNYSHAEGLKTIASNNYEHAQGTYNHSSINQIFSVGAGEIVGTTTTRRNAISVLAVPNDMVLTSSFFVQNVGGYDGTNPIPGTNDLATVINGITANAGTVTSVGVLAGAGITASVANATTTPTISISSAQAHTHSNKAELDKIASGDVAKWNAKQNAINDLATIRSKADNGQTAYDWGNHASAGYVKSGDITTAIDKLVTDSGSKWSTDTAVTSVGNHYKPKQSTIKNVIAGSVISGIYLDAAGHVTDVSSSSQINKATIATKLVGTSGSVDVPVYIDAGVPKTCKANIVSLPIFSKTQAEVQAQSGTITLIPGTVHKCGTLSNNLTINLDTGSIGSHEAIYCCVFNMGPTLQTITLPAGVKVVENSADLDTTDVYYEINIMNNVAIIARTAVS